MLIPHWKELNSHTCGGDMINTMCTYVKDINDGFPEEIREKTGTVIQNRLSDHFSPQASPQLYCISTNDHKMMVILCDLQPLSDQVP